MSKQKQIVKRIIALTLFAASMTFANRNYTVQDADKLKEIVLTTQGRQNSERPPFNCVCYGGPGNYRYEVPAIKGTVYGGPGNYPYTSWVCPSGCSRN
jgi:hypothetical protein